MADTTVIVAGISSLPLLIAQALSWRDMRRRTNGSGPLAGELREIKDGQSQHTERLVRIEDRVGRTEERVGRIEATVIEGNRLDRVEEKRVHLRDLPVAVPIVVTPPEPQ
jgi:hypothetical protein